MSNISSQKVAIVTGANKGIGKSIVKFLCQKFDGPVFLTSRDETRGHEALEDLKKLGLKPLYHQLDIDDVKSIENFRDFLKDNNYEIIALVNNAGIAFKNAAADPFHIQAETTIRINFTGTLNVCKILFPLLCPHARVVNSSSCMGQLLKITVKDHEVQSSLLRTRLSSPQLTEPELVNIMEEFVNATKEGNHNEKGWPTQSYTVSKVALSALTKVQQRDMDTLRPQDDIIINSVHPGWVITDMTGGQGVINCDEGAQSSVYLALLPPNVNSPKGEFIWHDNRIVDWEGDYVPEPGY